MSRFQEYVKNSKFDPQPRQLTIYSGFSPHSQYYSPDPNPQNSPPLSHAQDLIQSETSNLITLNHHSHLKSELAPIPQIIYENNRKVITQKIKFESDISEEISEEQLETPHIKKQQNSLLLTTANKKYGLKISAGFNSQYLDGKETERTLRFLTAQAYSVVCRKGSSTYKMVSEQIINNNLDILSSKEQNNIKRRVYDALNVLIALGKLEKKGRKIIPNKNFELQREHKQRIVQLKRRISQKQANLKTKQRFCKNQAKKSIFLKKLINRNSNSRQKNEKQRIYMPFILANSNELNKQDKGIGCQVRITLKNKQTNCKFYGDLDVINFIKFSSK